MLKHLYECLIHLNWSYFKYPTNSKFFFFAFFFSYNPGAHFISLYKAPALNMQRGLKKFAPVYHEKKKKLPLVR